MRLKRNFLCIGKAAGGPEKSDHIFVLAADPAEFLALFLEQPEKMGHQVADGTEPADLFIRMKQCIFLAETAAKLRKAQKLL